MPVLPPFLLFLSFTASPTISTAVFGLDYLATVASNEKAHKSSDMGRVAAVISDGAPPANDPATFPHKK